MRPFPAALRGAREIGFTVISMSVSLVAVFIPLLMMGGVVGRLFREFAVTLSVAIGVSLVVSLTTTPMMCAHMLRARTGSWPESIARANAVLMALWPLTGGRSERCCAIRLQPCWSCSAQSG